MLDMAVIKIQDKDYTLRFPLSAMLKAERMLGKSLQKLFVPQKEGEAPDYTLSDLLILFRLGLIAEHNFPDEQADELFSAFLKEGKSVYIQMTTLYLSLGKALGFFRTDENYQESLSKTEKTLLEK